MLETNIYFQDLDIGNQKKNIIILNKKILMTVEGAPKWNKKYDSDK